MSKNSVGFIIFGLISIAGLGLGGYTFLVTQIFIQPEESGPRLVGIWDALDDDHTHFPYITPTNWLFKLSANSYIDSEYVSVNNSGTRITLMKQGWYRIQISVLLQSLDAPFIYRIDLLKNGALLFLLDYVQTYTTTYDPYWHSINAEGYVLSDGNDYIELNANSNGDIFIIYSTLQDSNQVVIDFVSN